MKGKGDPKGRGHPIITLFGPFQSLSELSLTWQSRNNRGAQRVEGKAVQGQPRQTAEGARKLVLQGWN